jgi:HEPN domain-containing protein
MERQQKSAEELADQDERTNSMGLFNVAEAYRLSAEELRKARVDAGHAEHPIRFLYYHAVELYLKALLRLRHDVETIREDYGHKTLRLVREAENLGLLVDDEDRRIYELMGDTDAVIDSRYIRTGWKTSPTIESLSRTGLSLRSEVGRLLHKAGVEVRL